jgi:hypothetical protein
LWDRFKLIVREIGIGKCDVNREGAEHYISQLDAIRRDDIADAEIVLRKEVREVMEEQE